ncbi:MAG: ABC transporter ATP-binding protein [Candidatus Kapaibacterium sp.]|nr:MAG: ABC transporter ATP-binding protein [Candidatus Kapabacteria bacterium]
MTNVRLDRVTKSFDSSAPALSEVTLRIEAGEVMVVVGPSGCGKSTLLRLIAGLETVSSGNIYFDDEPITNLPPQQRDVGMVFQNYALYPHLTVAENLAFPLRVRKVPRSEQQERIRHVAALLGLEGLLDRLPKQLSGGQQQRVAVGRALVRSPRVFLFDEPLSNLDANLRSAMRTELAALQRRLGITTLYVTHDHVEAMTMGDRIAVIEGGKLLQVGAPEQLYTNPDNLFVATFLGTPPINTIEGTLVQAGEQLHLVAPDAGLQLVLPQSVLRRPLSHSEQRATLAVRAEHVFVASDAPPDVSGIIEAIEYTGHERLVHVRVGRVPVVLRLNGHEAIQRGQTIGLCFDRAGVLVFDSSGNRL